MQKDEQMAGETDYTTLALDHNMTLGCQVYSQMILWEWNGITWVPKTFGGLRTEFKFYSKAYEEGPWYNVNIPPFHHTPLYSNHSELLQFPEDAVPLSCPHNPWCTASSLLRKSSTKTQVKDWFLCDVFLHSLRKWLLPLPYSFLFHTLTQISLTYIYNILQLTVCMFERSGFSSVQFSHPVMSNSLQPHGLQHARPPCQSPTHGAYSNSCPLSSWGHPTISSSVVPFSSHLQSFPASGYFHMSHFFASGSQSIGVSASASVLPMNPRTDFL